MPAKGRTRFEWHSNIHLPYRDNGTVTRTYMLRRFAQLYRLQLFVTTYTRPLRCLFPAFRRSVSSLATPSEPHLFGHECLLEEETLPDYRKEHYYPFRLGEVFNDCYKSVGKLGYGTASTVWLCRDLFRPQEYVALKVYINCSKYHRELGVYQHINSYGRTTLEGMLFGRLSSLLRLTDRMARISALYMNRSVLALVS